MRAHKITAEIGKIRKPSSHLQKVAYLFNLQFTNSCLKAVYFAVYKQLAKCWLHFIVQDTIFLSTVLFVYE